MCDHQRRSQTFRRWASKLQPISYRSPSFISGSTSRRKYSTRERAKNILRIVSHTKRHAKCSLFSALEKVYQLLAYAMPAYHRYETGVSFVLECLPPLPVVLCLPVVRACLRMVLCQETMVVKRCYLPFRPALSLFSPLQRPHTLSSLSPGTLVPKSWTGLCSQSRTWRQPSYDSG